MQTIIHYRCDGCQEVHEDSCDIFECKICKSEICVDCKTDDDTCYDDCKPSKLSPRKTICKACNGSGYWDSFNSPKCGACNGKGYDYEAEPKMFDRK